ncbi:PBSX family phage terminase large subunit [Microbacterium sp. MYb64]|uniref:PBSX family phage terminase large subunit n=1 Tax=Microbacterium sp. MYb64 TaxID=1848691 RepID=UPI000CFC9C24|nr:PBSX family phage terminase large subunit [Microbacterium sp. MYb64]PRB01763.1 PBSX family phage terminase large subunit [Microbacterium sp. MYb64]
MTPPALSRKQRWSIARAASRKIALWVGAVSAGKTFVSLLALFIAIRKARGRGLIVIIGKTLQTIERNVIGEMQKPELFGRLAKQVKHTPGSNTAIILGRVVHLVGANDARSEEKIRGSTIELAYVDEATLLPEGFWEMLITRLRVAGARLLATTNPGSSQHWLRVRYILDADAQDMVVFHFTMHDNPLYFEGGDPGPAYIRSMEAAFAKSKVFHDRFIRGLWTTAEGAVYDGWDPVSHVIPWERLPPMYRLLGVGMDFGTQHATSVGILGLGYDRKLYLIDELRIESDGTAQRQSPSQQAKAIADWLKINHLPEGFLRPEILAADPAALAYRQELRESQGIDTVPADNSVLYGIGLVTSLLARGLLLITDRCWGVIKEMPDYVWDPKKAEKGDDAPIKAKDDSLDMLRYVITSTEGEWRDEVGTRTNHF